MTLILDERLLGAHPSPADPHDWQIADHLDTATPLPSKFRLALLGPVLNQGNTGRCVAFSGTGLRQQEERAGGDWPKGWPPLDPEWLYEHAEAIDGIPIPPGLQRGTTIRAGLQVLSSQGQPLIGKPATAGEFKVATYHAVPYTPDAIKRALIQFRSPIWIATRWNTAWFRPVNGVMPAPTGTWDGGHARYIWGWDDSVGGHLGSPLVRNSWRRTWLGSINGNSYDPWGPLLAAMHDAWTTADVLHDFHGG